MVSNHVIIFFELFYLDTFYLMAENTMHYMNNIELNNKIAVILKTHFQYSIAYRILHLLLVIAIISLLWIYFNDSISLLFLCISIVITCSFYCSLLDLIEDCNWNNNNPINPVKFQEAIKDIEFITDFHLFNDKVILDNIYECKRLSDFKYHISSFNLRSFINEIKSASCANQNNRNILVTYNHNITYYDIGCFIKKWMK